MTTKDWQVFEVSLNYDNPQFPYHVVGRFNAPGTDYHGTEFRWSVPSIDNPRYDLSLATFKS